MQLSALRDVVTSKVARQALILGKHSPTILFASGIVGVVATAVLASRATLNLDEVLGQTSENLATAKELHESGHLAYTDQDYLQDRVQIRVRAAYDVTKLYGPTVTVGVLSIAALAGSHNILTQRNAGLVAAYAAIERGFSEYRERVLKEVGPEKELEFRYPSERREIITETAKGHKVTEEVRVAPHMPSHYAKFFDDNSSSWNRNAETNYFFLRCQLQWANDRLRTRGHLFLNEVYEALGLEHTSAGAVVGWLYEKGTGDDYVDFGMFDGTNEKIRDFVNGREYSILLDFNVDGTIYDKI